MATALQKKIAEANEASLRKISERDCFELVQKLAELDHAKVFQSNIGKEWLTPEQLDSEISDALNIRGGRLSITDLPPEMGVSVEHIESRVEALCKKDSSLTKLQGELMSEQYLLSVTQRIDASLAELGCLTVSDLAVSYNLPADFVRGTLLGRLKMPHTAKQNVIFTDAYTVRIGMRARGALRGCTVPVTLAHMASRHRLDPDMLVAAVQKMIKDGTLLGKLQGSTFTPKVFADKESGKIDDFYNTNQYMPLSMAKSSDINIKTWAKEKNIEGLTLSTAFVDNQIIEPAVASIKDAMGKGSWIDVMSLLPSALPSADSQELLQQSKKKLPGDTIILEHVAVSKKFVSSLSSKFEADAKAEAERLLTAPAAKAGKKPVAGDDDDDDGGSKKKGKRGAKGKKGRGDDDDDDAGPSAKAGGAESAIDSQNIIDVLCESYPAMPADVHEDICGLVQPLISKMIHEHQTSLQASQQNKRKEQFETVEKFIQEHYEMVVLGLKALEAKNLASSPLQQHLLREAVAEPLHRLLALRLHELTGTVMEVTSANRKQCFDQIAGKLGAAKAEPLSRLLGAVTGKKPEAPKADKAPKDEGSKKGKKGERKKKGDMSSDEEGAPAAAAAPETLDAIYHAAADDCHIFCKKVDKKREKTALQEAIAGCKEKLKGTTEAEAAVDAIKAVCGADIASKELCALALQYAVLQDGVPGLLFSADAWAMKLVAKSLSSEDVQEEALKLCALVPDA